VISVNGFVSSSYSYNFNRPHLPRERLPRFRFRRQVVQDRRRRSWCCRSRPRTRATRVFAWTSASGRLHPPRHGPAGLFRDAFGNGAGHRSSSSVRGYLANARPWSQAGLREVVTHFGYEVIDGYDGLNDNVTRSLLFGYAIPSRTPASGRVSILRPRFRHGDGRQRLDDATDRNQQKSIGAQLSLTPAAAWTVS